MASLDGRTSQVIYLAKRKRKIHSRTCKACGGVYDTTSTKRPYICMYCRYRIRRGLSIHTPAERGRIKARYPIRSPSRSDGRTSQRR